MSACSTRPTTCRSGIGDVAPRRTLNDAITQFWSVAAPLYDLPGSSALGVSAGARRSDRGAERPRRPQGADIACGTGILVARIVSELHPGEVYSVAMSDGMLAQARMLSSQVQWRKGPARQSAQPGTQPIAGRDAGAVRRCRHRRQRSTPRPPPDVGSGAFGFDHRRHHAVTGQGT